MGVTMCNSIRSRSQGQEGRQFPIKDKGEGGGLRYTSSTFGAALHVRSLGLAASSRDFFMWRVSLPSDFRCTNGQPAPRHAIVVVRLWKVTTACWPSLNPAAAHLTLT